MASAATIAAAAIGGPAAAAAPAQAPEPTAVDVTKRPAEVREYWTAKRMREAIPLGPLAEIEGEARTAKRGGSSAKPVARVNRKPRRAHGKVFFRLGGTNYVCSGTSADAPTGRLVWTAGHCVYEPNGLLEPVGYATNWQFVPAYKSGREPFGEWPATRLAATPQWRSSGCAANCGDYRFDLGAAIVARNGANRTLKEVVGARRLGFNAPRSQTYRAFGYPATGSFDGTRMYRCRSPLTGSDYSSSPQTMRISCDMTAGASGGGWVANGKLLSVISYGYATEEGSLYGPYQGSAAKGFYSSVKNG